MAKQFQPANVNQAGSRAGNSQRLSGWARRWECLSAALVALCAYPSAAAPEILITDLPRCQSTNQLSGLVRGVSPNTCRVATFTYSSAEGWNTKSFDSATSLTPIQPDGTWATDITSGGSDTNATRIAALLVRANFNYPLVRGAATLSTNLLSQALATAIVTRPGLDQRCIRFSGYDWLVRSRTGGPGPNCFSDSTNNVWLDASGRLHLRITRRSNQWQCAEIYSTRSFGYGSYRFRLDSRVDTLNDRVVLGLFTYSSDPVFHDREIDVEFGRWANPGDPSNAQFVVQPPASGHLVRFAVPAEQTNSTHLFTWESNRVAFQSLGGAYLPGLDPTNVLADWTFASSGVPQAGDEIVAINLWLFRGIGPADGSEVEVVLRSFEFVPLGTLRAYGQSGRGSHARSTSPPQEGDTTLLSGLTSGGQNL